MNCPHCGESLYYYPQAHIDSCAYRPGGNKSGHMKPLERNRVENDAYASRSDVERTLRESGVYASQSEESFQNLVDQQVNHKNTKR